MQESDAAKDLFTKRHEISTELGNFLDRYKCVLSYTDGKPIREFQERVWPEEGTFDDQERHVKMLQGTRQALLDYLSDHGDNLTFEQGEDLQKIEESIPQLDEE